MNFSILFATTAALLGIVGVIPYLRDIFRRKTTPHIYTWFIWMTLQATGFSLMVSEGAGAGALSTGIWAGINAFIFVLSFKYGTTNIRVFDTVCLIGALLATALWFLLHDALLSIIVVSVIDVLAYIPTFRKAYVEPYSETISMYILGGISCIFSLLALSTFSVTTSLYLIVVCVSNFAGVGLVWFRRRGLYLRK
ncbi:MAG: hypothetical protein EXS51_01350 [Candidatus Taylorbacteria bacterium]|nr:hypothetical protein [Candidatus Taylorbacteria bacterium]